MGACVYRGRGERERGEERKKLCVQKKKKGCDIVIYIYKVRERGKKKGNEEREREKREREKREREKRERERKEREREKREKERNKKVNHPPAQWLSPDPFRPAESSPFFALMKN